MTNIYVLTYAVDCAEGRMPTVRTEAEFFKNEQNFLKRADELKTARTKSVRKFKLELVAMSGIGVVDNFIVRPYDE